MKTFQSLGLPGLAVTLALLVQWYVHLPAPTAVSSAAQVEQEAKDGGYRLMDIAVLSKLYRSNPERILLVDTRQEWEHRVGHIDGSVSFPLEPTRWDRWRKRADLKALLEPNKDKSIVFY